MDLLGDLGTADQLTSTRAENKVLAEKVKQLTEKVKELTLENAQLLAEVEMYRNDGNKRNSITKSIQEEKSPEVAVVAVADEFIKSGNGVYPNEAAVTLSHLHGASNPLCCALDPTDTIVATGGADSNLVLCSWGGGLAPGEHACRQVVQQAARIRSRAPIISVGFSNNNNNNRSKTICAAGGMDGTVLLVRYASLGGGKVEAKLLVPSKPIKHVKYVKTCVWCPNKPLLATASADGNVVISKVNNGAEDKVEVETVQTLHLPGAVESMCFSNDGHVLYCYARGTPYLSCFDLNKDYEQTKLNLNSSGVNGGFEDHVSFAVMDMSPSPNGKYLALATDTSRNIIIDATTGKQIRNLYGHENDGFSQPKIAWSRNGQYLFGNTQTDNDICVWDIASGSIIQTLKGHKGQVRGICSSPHSDTMVTTSFDKDTKIWLTAVE